MPGGVSENGSRFAHLYEEGGFAADDVVLGAKSREDAVDGR